MPEFREEEVPPRPDGEDDPGGKVFAREQRPEHNGSYRDGTRSEYQGSTGEETTSVLHRSGVQNADATLATFRAPISDARTPVPPLKRTALRTAIYFLYDGVAGERKEPYRVAKVILETILDECMPPPRGTEMSVWRKCSEYLAPCALSSLLWFMIEQIRILRRRTLIGRKDVLNKSFVLRAAWTTVHRTLRQALINRLFFRIGSVEYSLASLLGIVCCFFREDIFFEIYRLKRWPKYFSLPQGLGALFRSLIYAAAFSLPLHKVSSSLLQSRRRRGNAKKFIFAVVLTQVKYLHKLSKRLSSVSPQF